MAQWLSAWYASTLSLLGKNLPNCVNLKLILHNRSHAMACAKNKSVQRQEVGSCCPVVEDYYVDDTVGPWKSSQQWHCRNFKWTKIDPKFDSNDR